MPRSLQEVLPAGQIEFAQFAPSRLCDGMELVLTDCRFNSVVVFITRVFPKHYDFVPAFGYSPTDQVCAVLHLIGEKILFEELREGANHLGADLVGLAPVYRGLSLLR